ncbi:MAG TPA: 50S ribosomal protein L25 [Lachnospiraceae bacterium]|nr:50S ribosomal protein L25 [uncultured Lachnoclostridium sp.]HAU87371.1 50S ribosomal protein L25 [Lachnospiraceae bacterium]
MNTLKVQTRDMETKAKRLRREGYITGNLFGREIKGSIPIKVKLSEAEGILKQCVVGTQIMLDVEGKQYDVLIKEMDYDAMKKQLIEVDFQALVSGEKVHSVAEIILHNKEKVVEGVLEQLLTEISYKAYPADLVDKIDLDVSSLRLGDTVKVSDLDLAKNENVDIMTSKDAVVVNVIQSHVVAETEDDDVAATEE